MQPFKIFSRVPKQSSGIQSQIKSMDVVEILSLNTNGLADDKKRRDVLYWLKKGKASIILLQETHSKAENEKDWKKQWDGNIIFSHGESNSRGVCILFKDNLDIIIKKEIIDKEGRYIILDVVMNEKQMTLVNIYAPNKDDPDFFVAVSNLIETLPNDNRIIGGDFNLVLDVDKDKKGGQTKTHEKARLFIKHWADESDLVDIWRLKHPDIFQYTWSRRRPAPIFCRLDFYLVSFGVCDLIVDTLITPGFKSDHSGVRLRIKLFENVRGPNFWKFNTSLLSDLDYVNEIKATISETANIEVTSPRLLWDTIKMNVRGATIRFASRKKKSRRNKISCLEHKIDRLEKLYSATLNPNTFESLTDAKEELKNHIETSSAGAIIRSRIKWVEEGEKSSKFFFNLEKRNFNNKCINCLKDKQGHVVSSPETIRKNLRDFYQKLYTAKPHNLETLEEVDNRFFQHNAPKLDNDQMLEIEGPITEQELLQALKKTPNNKAPGTDGFQAEFYKVFWHDIKKYLLAAIEESYNLGQLTISQREGIISLLPKKDKDPLYLKNWRPLTLLNSDYKLIAKVIATRIKKFLPDLIHTDQTGFIAGRFIGENIVKTLDIMDFVQENDIPALLILVDFEKAFDFLDWNFIEKSLTFFNFGNSIKHWIKVLYKDISSYVINNGWTTDPIHPTRGVRQGCPLSPYLFVLCAEILALSIRNNNDIRGIEIEGHSNKISQFADDATLTILFCRSSLQAVIETFDQFEIVSGLKVNYDKTEILRIGSIRNSNAKIYTGRKLHWTNDPVKLLGISITTDKNTLLDTNFEPLIKKIENIIKVWKQRQLTIYGKSLIIKTLLVSQLVYRLSVLPTPKSAYFQKLNNIIYGFLWNNKPPRISRNTLIGPINWGGINMVHVENKEKALKIAWVKRLLAEGNQGSWKILASRHFPDNGKIIWSGNLNSQDLHELSIKNLFWKNVLAAWCEFNYKCLNPTTVEEVMNSQLWFNSSIRIGNKPIYNDQLFQAGIATIRDLLSEEGKFLDFDALKQKYDVNINFIFYLGIISAIPKTWKQIIRTHFNTHQHAMARDIAIIEIQNGVFKKENATKFIYTCLTHNKAMVATAPKIKWETTLSVRLTEEQWQNIFVSNHYAVIDNKLRYLQYRVLHRTLTTNRTLKIWGKRADDNCTFCQREPETIVHLLFDCAYTYQLWTRFVKWLRDKTGYSVQLSASTCILGYQDLDDFSKFMNTLFIVVKKFIYSSRCNKTTLSFKLLLSNIKEMHHIEKSIAQSKNRATEHSNKWNLLQENFLEL